ncbi:MAG: 50S ribosomal protein L11 methyltransferase [Thermincolia bacterium]
MRKAMISMQWMEISVTVDRDGVEAVSNTFERIGSGGVVIEDPLLVDEYINSNRWDYYELPSQPALAENKVLVKGYLPEDRRLPERLEELREQLNNLQQYYLPGCHAEIATSTVAEEDWANSWKVYFKPEKVGQRVVIKPSWEEYQAQKDEIIVELDPGMAFGTGTHHTTAMCIRALEKYLQPGQRVYDVGTGSGVLSITAAKLGAGQVLAIDLDETAVRVAKANVEASGENHRIKVIQGNLLDVVKEPADLVVANIIADTIKVVSPDVLSRLAPGGIFIVSGIIDDRAQDVRTKLLSDGFKIIGEETSGGWVAFVACSL